MILLSILILTFLLGGTLVLGVRSWRDEASVRLKAGFVLLLIVGGAVGVWCTFYLEYQPSPTLRFTGFPVPARVLHLENGDWVDFVGPGWWINLIIVPFVIALPASLPLIVRARRRRRLERSQGFPIIPNQP